ncbi:MULTISPECIES: carboxylate-amine ligase [unclassified Streptomyces]|uniref:carboxylate-amine ligase n=1 Tax=unclassified Streptomyces TaxID=2593676 RepID=UPI002E1297AD|nr:MULTISPECIES: glutamate--cysteine ligase [unclassified Streptomyces]WSR22836.1 glutamate--cysteine ligase [Streptomyces sp. NBC_01205]
MITVGVEEEYLLVDPETFLPTPLVQEVRATARLAPLTEEREVQDELLQAQIEVATPVCTALEEVGGHLLRLRHAVASAAQANGCCIAISATAPVRDAVPVPITSTARYVKMRQEARLLVDEQLICGMHVHVGMPDRETAVAVLNRMRVWLPTLLAMSANSPLWDGRDTGFASWRTVVFGRWPVSGPPPHFAGLADYEERVDALVKPGVIPDRGQLYWQARLSERYPTVEVRCCDVQLEADDAVMLAGIIRGLAATAIAEVTAGTALAPCRPELLQAATWHAARHGLGSTLVSPAGRLESGGDVLRALLRYIGPALEENGDHREVTALVHRLLQRGTAAERQRRALAEAGLPAVGALMTAGDVSA